MKAKEFIEQLRHDDIVAAIRQAETRTSGEIRVFISHKTIKDPVRAAQKEFEKLSMTRTREKNGVLIFVAPLSRNFAIIGDAGVHAKCGDGFWQAVAGAVTEHFRKSEFSEGIIHGVTRSGELLAEHFPRRPDDRNELPDDVAHD